jgi:endonuclease/exonuclease/phosphatase family metal-dependent hydrolase
MYKIIISIVLIYLSALQIVWASQDVKINIATYNIRIQTSADSGARAWDQRKIAVKRIIDENRFDVFGVQEIVNKNQEADFKALIPEFTYVGRGRDNFEGTKGEQIGVFFKSARFELLSHGSFFLSQTPDTLSKGWDAALRRMCVWLKLSDRNSESDFYVFCTHFDHKGVIARVESAKLIVNRVHQIAGDSPVIFLGDLNTSPESTEMYQTICADFDDTRAICTSKIEESVGTFNGYDVTKTAFPISERIDYIFCRRFLVNKYMVINTSYSKDTYPSDHFPILVECVIKH